MYVSIWLLLTRLTGSSDLTLMHCWLDCLRDDGMLSAAFGGILVRMARGMVCRAERVGLVSGEEGFARGLSPQKQLLLLAISGN